jgi:peptidoglycan hydrolase CwlO-like protein
LIKGYFISFVILTAIVSFNVFVAVLTSQVHEKFVNDQKMNKSKLSELQGDIQDTEQELQAGFKQVLRELQLLREEVERLRSNKG